jgi:hypothetical protein
MYLYSIKRLLHNNLITSYVGNICTGLTFNSSRFMGSKTVRVVFRHVIVWHKPGQQVKSTGIFHFNPDKDLG